MDFQDESRDIASEYRGGIGRYAALERSPPPQPPPPEDSFDFALGGSMSAPSMAQQPLPPIHPLPPRPFAEPTHPAMAEPAQDGRRGHAQSNSDATSYSNPNMQPPPAPSYGAIERPATPPGGGPDYLTSPEEVLFMQVFVEEVGLWMDSMDPYKHVRSRPPLLARES